MSLQRARSSSSSWSWSSWSPGGRRPRLGVSRHGFWVWHDAGEASDPRALELLEMSMTRLLIKLLSAVLERSTWSPRGPGQGEGPPTTRRTDPVDLALVLTALVAIVVVAGR